MSRVIGGGQNLHTEVGIRTHNPNRVTVRPLGSAYPIVIKYMGRTKAGIMPKSN
jgi:hypothetical protein